MDEHDNLRCTMQWCRAASLLLALAVANPALAAASSESRCDELPEPRRAHCEKVLDCMAIDDAGVRRVCLEEARRQSERPPAQPARQGTTPGGPPVLVEETLGTPPPRGRPQEAPLSPPIVPREPPPDHFHAEVTGIHQSILNRQVIALDNRYVFEGEHARRARLKQGQEVEVRRMKSRFGSGRNWRVTGPARIPVELLRIRCERDDIGSDDRRRCERMLDR